MDEPPTRTTCARTAAAYPDWSGYVNIQPKLRHNSFKITHTLRSHALHKLPRVVCLIGAERSGMETAQTSLINQVRYYVALGGTGGGRDLEVHQQTMPI